MILPARLKHFEHSSIGRNIPRYMCHSILRCAKKQVWRLQAKKRLSINTLIQEVSSECQKFAGVVTSKQGRQYCIRSSQTWRETFTILAVYWGKRDVSSRSASADMKQPISLLLLSAALWKLPIWLWPWLYLYQRLRYPRPPLSLILRLKSFQLFKLLPAALLLNGRPSIKAGGRVWGPFPRNQRNRQAVPYKLRTARHAPRH